jgi:hypothetical protein
MTLKYNKIILIKRVTAVVAIYINPVHQNKVVIASGDLEYVN